MAPTQRAFDWPPRLYLDLLLHVVKDEPLRVDEVVGGEERHSVQRPAVHAAALHRPAARLGPDQTLDGRDKGLQWEKKMVSMEPRWVSAGFSPSDGT